MPAEEKCLPVRRGADSDNPNTQKRTQTTLHLETETMKIWAEEWDEGIESQRHVVLRQQRLSYSFLLAQTPDRPHKGLYVTEILMASVILSSGDLVRCLLGLSLCILFRRF